MLRGLWIAVAVGLVFGVPSRGSGDDRVESKLSRHLGAVIDGKIVLQEPVVLRAATARGKSAEGLRALVRSRAFLAARDDGSGFGTLWVQVAPEEVADTALSLAAHPDVVWVERYALPVIKNDNSTWLLQSGSQSEGRTVFRHGLTGWGQVAGVADSGLDADACQFRYGADRQAVTLAVDTPQPPESVMSNPDNKVITYYVVGSAEAYDDSHGGYHGTHTTGDTAGDNYENLATASAAGHDPQDGMAPGAQIVFQDIGANNGTLSGLMGTSMYDLLKQAYDTGARVHSNSYGSPYLVVEYDADSASIDAAMWEYNDLLVVFAAGNSGMDQDFNLVPESLGGTGSTAKNTLVSGASGPVETIVFGISFHLKDDLLAFSSQGPTSDGRIKPDVVAPGLVLSATTDPSTLIDLGNQRNTTDHQDDNCNVDEAGASFTAGTSFSAPLTAGAAILVRQYYTDGFWYLGASDLENGFNPTNALVKATIINGATALEGENFAYVSTTPLSPVPSFEQGWGRVNLEQALYFEGDTRKTILLNDTPNPAPGNPMLADPLPPFPDGTPALYTGDELTWILPYSSPDFPLKVTLAWSDPPAQAGAVKTLVNDLDLTVLADNSDQYLGNQDFDEDGFSQPSTTGEADSINNVEQVIIKSPAGSHQLSVKATAVPGNWSEGSDAQGYALLVSGEFLPPVPETIEPSEGLPATILESVQLTGRNFVDGLQLDLGPGITIEDVQVIDSQNALIGSLIINRSAETGSRDVTASLYRNIRGVGEGLFMVGDAGQGDGGTNGGNGAGCGCSTTADKTLLLSLLCLLVLISRRRSR